jgi:hypothetical protein
MDEARPEFISSVEGRVAEDNGPVEEEDDNLEEFFN